MTTRDATEATPVRRSATRRNARLGVAAMLIVALIGGVLLVVNSINVGGRTHMVGYFANSTGIFVGDEVRILGVPVGKIDAIEPQPQRAKISFWVDDQYQIPADAKAVILSPALVTARAIQLVPVYTGGPTMADNAVIPLERTAVPVEWDDFRDQLQKLTDTLKPTEPGGVSSLGAFINTAADNLRGQGANIRQSLIELSQAFSALGDHSTDIFSTVKNLSVLVTALQDSSGILAQLNQNFAAVTGTLADDPDKVGQALKDIGEVTGQVKDFVAANRDALGTTSDKLASLTTAVQQALPDVKQLLHTLPTAAANFQNIYQPSQAALTGALAVNNFANPITFLCGAIQAASRLGAEQAAKLCVQYLAPIIKNRQYNFPPLGFNPFVGEAARPNELTYSEDWLRPDYVPPPGSAPAAAVPGGPAALPAESPAPPPAPSAPPGAPPAVQTNPADGLTGLMTTPGGG